MALYTTSGSGGIKQSGGIGTKIVGMDNVIASLKRCSNESRKKKLLRRVLSFGAFPMWKQMKANAPMRTGNLKQSISRISSRRNALVVVGARANKSTGFYNSCI